MTLEEQQQTLQRVVAQMDEVLRFQDETLAREDAREAEFKAERSGNKRAMFAAMAMQGILSCGYDPHPLGDHSAASDDKAIAENAVGIADALLAALSQ